MSITMQGPFVVTYEDEQNWNKRHAYCIPRSDTWTPPTGVVYTESPEGHFVTPAGLVYEQGFEITNLETTDWSKFNEPSFINDIYAFLQRMLTNNGSPVKAKFEDWAVNGFEENWQTLFKTKQWNYKWFRIYQ